MTTCRVQAVISPLSPGGFLWLSGRLCVTTPLQSGQGAPGFSKNERVSGNSLVMPVLMLLRVFQRICHSYNSSESTLCTEKGGVDYLGAFLSLVSVGL